MYGKRRLGGGEGGIFIIFYSVRITLSGYDGVCTAVDKLNRIAQKAIVFVWFAPSRKKKKKIEYRKWNNYHTATVQRTRYDLEKRVRFR